MAAGPRSEVVRKGEPGIYHVWTRTVRQAFLCGYDHVTGKDYTARRAWIRAFEEMIAGIFAIEIAFRCEMSNHLHLVLKAQPEVVKHWSDTEVVTRWLRLKRLVWSKDGETIKEITDQQTPNADTQLTPQQTQTHSLHPPSQMMQDTQPPHPCHQPHKRQPPSHQNLGARVPAVRNSLSATKTPPFATISPGPVPPDTTEA